MRATTTTKKQLTDRVAEETKINRAIVKRLVQALLDAMIEDLAGGRRIEFRDFGVFEIKYRAPRIAQNPKTLEPVQIPARRAVKFKVGRVMRERLDRISPARAAASQNGHASTVEAKPKRRGRPKGSTRAGGRVVSGKV